MSLLKPCPFCGQDVYIEKKSLWHDSHGYYGCFEYVIECSNPYCQCRISLPRNDTIYNSDKDARENVIKAWNRRNYGKSNTN